MLGVPRGMVHRIAWRTLSAVAICRNGIRLRLALVLYLIIVRDETLINRLYALHGSRSPSSIRHRDTCLNLENVAQKKTSDWRRDYLLQSILPLSFIHVCSLHILSEIEFLLTVLLVRYILRRTSNIVFLIDEIFRYNQYLHWLDIYRLFCLSKL